MIFVNIQGEEIPALGLGTWELRGEECVNSVRHALEIGYRHIDTARGYDNEEFVGQAIRRSGVPRNEIFLSTKIWIGGKSAREVEQEALESLRALDIDYVDLLLVHWPAEDMDLAAALTAMDGLRDLGDIRHIGVSNFVPRLLIEAMRHAPIFCNQVEYHPYLAQTELLDLARERDVLLAAYSPVGKGGVLNDETLLEIGRRHGKSTAQVALRWLIQQEKVAALPKAAKAKHRLDNFDIFDFVLDEEEMQRIFALARQERFTDPEWASWHWPAVGLSHRGHK